MYIQILNSFSCFTFSYFDDYHYTTDQYFWNMSCNPPVGHEIHLGGPDQIFLKWNGAEGSRVVWNVLENMSAFHVK